MNRPFEKIKKGTTCEISLCRPFMDTVVYSSQHPDSFKGDGLHGEKVGSPVPVLSPLFQYRVFSNSRPPFILFLLHSTGTGLPLGRPSGDCEVFAVGGEYLSVRRRRATLQPAIFFRDPSDQDGKSNGDPLWG